MANELHLYPSEVYNSIKRARASHFIQRPELEDRLNRSALLEFLLHGIRYRRTQRALVTNEHACVAVPSH
jgi:hypothetical protein